MYWKLLTSLLFAGYAWGGVTGRNGSRDLVHAVVRSADNPYIEGRVVHAAKRRVVCDFWENHIGVSNKAVEIHPKVPLRQRIWQGEGRGTSYGVYYCFRSWRINWHGNPRSEDEYRRPRGEWPFRIIRGRAGTIFSQRFGRWSYQDISASSHSYRWSLSRIKHFRRSMKLLATDYFANELKAGRAYVWP